QKEFVREERGGLVGVADILHRGQQPEQATQVRQLQFAQGALEMRVQRTGEGDHQVHGGGLSGVRSSSFLPGSATCGAMLTDTLMAAAISNEPPGAEAAEPEDGGSIRVRTVWISDLHL